MEEWLSTGDCARALQMTPQGVTKALRSGRLAGRRRGRDWFIPAAALERYRSIRRHRRGPGKKGAT
jgi:hypothetical protein